MTLYQPRLTPLSVSLTNHPIRSISFQSTPDHQLYSNKTRKLLTGSASPSTLNTLSLYELTVDSGITPSLLYDDNDEVMNNNKSNVNNLDEPLSECLGSAKILGEINHVKFTNENIAAISTSQGKRKNGEVTDGQVALFSLENRNNIPELKCIQHWEEESNVLALAVQNIGPSTLAAGTAIGTLTFYNPNTQQILQTINHASTSSITSLTYAGAHTLYGTSLSGSLLVWDTRDHNINRATQTIRRSSSSAAFTSITAHPSRYDTVLCGDDKGIVSTFDIRKGSSELMSIPVGDNCSVWALSLLPFDPAAGVVATEDGKLSLIDFNVSKKDPALVSYDSTDGNSISVEVRTLYVGSRGMNCVDIDRSSHTIVAGNDSQNLVHFQYYCHNLLI